MNASGDLPVEIWQQIYEHVPKSEAIRLYAVNRALYHIVMSEKYAHTHCSGHPFGHEDKRAYAQALRPNRSTSKYIQKLTISLELLCLRFDVHPTGTGSLATPTKTTIQNLYQTFSTPTATDLQPYFPALHTLSITASDEDSPQSESSTYHHFRDTFAISAANALQSLSQTLRALDLSQLPLEFYRDISATSLVFLPILEDLRLGIRTMYHTTTDYESILQTHLCPFINRHSTSLKRLELQNRNTRQSPSYYYKYGVLFRHVTHIPGLAELSVRFALLPSDPESLDALNRFIHAHSSSLSHLELYLYHSTLSCLEPRTSRGGQSTTSRQLELDMLTAPYTPQTLFTHALFRTSLPSCSALKHLSCIILSEDSLQLTPQPFLSWLPSLPYLPTLITLSLPYNVFNQPDLITLVSTADFSSLRKLRLKVQAFDLALFDAFAANLPSLQELRLSADALYCSLVDGSQVEVRFIIISTLENPLTFDFRSTVPVDAYRPPPLLLSLPRPTTLTLSIQSLHPMEELNQPCDNHYRQETRAAGVSVWLL